MFEDARPWKLALPPAGRVLAVAESSTYVSIWDLQTRHFRRRLVLRGAARLPAGALNRPK